VEAPQPRADLGERKGPSTRRALEDGVSHCSLERCDLLADRRLGVPELSRRPSETALVGNDGERLEMTKLDARPALQLLHANPSCAWVQPQGVDLATPIEAVPGPPARPVACRWGRAGVERPIRYR